MNTASYKRTYNLPFTFDDVLKLNSTENKNIVITVYQPDSNIWMENFKTRR
jgi:hypothetical protein